MRCADPHVRMYDSHWPLHFVGYAFTSMLDLFRGDIDGQAQLIWLLQDRLVVAVYIFMLWLRFTRLNWRNCHKFANIAWTKTTTVSVSKRTCIFICECAMHVCIYVCMYVYTSGIGTNSNEYRLGESRNVVSYPSTTRWEFQKTGAVIDGIPASFEHVQLLQWSIHYFAVVTDREVSLEFWRVSRAGQ